jgi:hypothetical protein
MALQMGGAGFDARYRGAPPEVPGAVVAWLATDPGAERFRGQTVRAQKLCADRALLPGWPP